MPRRHLFSVPLVHVQWDPPLISVSVPSKPQWVVAGCGVYSFSNHLVVFPVNLMSETFARPHACDGTSNAITPGNMKKHSRSNYVKLEVYSIMLHFNLIQLFMWVSKELLTYSSCKQYLQMMQRHSFLNCSRKDKV